jgi:hypothetical protein
MAILTLSGEAPTGRVIDDQSRVPNLLILGISDMGSSRQSV